MADRMADGTVVAVARDAGHGFSTHLMDEVRVLTGLGIQGDAHQGVTVQHRSRMARDPAQPNLRQVHLIHAELFEELKAKGFAVGPAGLGENVTTRGIDLLGLPKGARLRLGAEAVLEVTGLRNPCAQIERFQAGLLAAVLGRGPDGELVRKTGAMAVALSGGAVRPRDVIAVELPSPPHQPLEPV